MFDYKPSKVRFTVRSMFFIPGYETHRSYSKNTPGFKTRANE